MTLKRATITALCVLLIGCGGVAVLDKGPGPDGAGGQGGNGAGGTGGQGAKLNDGLHLLSWAPPQSPTIPFVFIADLAVGAADYSFTLQPLDAEDRSTPVGSLSSHGPFPIDDDSPFSPTIDTLFIPGETNPLPASDLVVENIVFDGSSSTPDLVCGVTGGTVTVPLNLSVAGATFTLVPQEGGAFPEPPPIDCAGTLAEPL